MSLEGAAVMGQASCAALLRMARIIASNPVNAKASDVG